MPTPTATFVKNAHFDHKGQNYTVAAFIEPTDPHTTHVEAISGGKPVVINYPGGQQGTLSYSVSIMTAASLGIGMGINAVDHLMETAEADIRRLV